MAMHNPELYQKFNSFQKQDALKVIQTNTGNMKWKNNASIIDIGCGDGLVTSILIKHLQGDFKELVGVDISKAMIEHANKKYGDEKTRFEVMDLTSETPDYLKARFDHVFSSYCLQFIGDQEKVYKNIYNLLKDGGNFLLLFMGASPFVDAYLKVAENVKWKDYTKNLDQILPNLCCTEEEKRDYEKLITDIGFTEVEVRYEKTSYTYDHPDQLRSMIESANIYNIPRHLLEDHLDEYMKYIFNMDGADILDNGALKVDYIKTVVLGRK